MGIKTGTKIKEARTSAGLTQEKLAQKLTGITASDISKAERGEKELTQSVLKEIAKATGVTQASLLNAEKAADAKPASKVDSSKTPTGKKTAKTEEYKLTPAEKNLIELYRSASSDAKKNALQILKGEKNEMEQLISSLLGGSLEKLLSGK